MKKVLIAYEKHANRIFDISTHELREKAYTKLFKERKADGYYKDLQEMQSIPYARAIQGEVDQIIRVLTYHKNHEYERIEQQEIENV